MIFTILSLHQASSITSVGGKALALGELLHAGLPVPSGFVVTTHADLNSAESKILEHFDSLHSPFVAVRSSAVAEDGQNAAWAGQLETYLNIQRDGLLTAIQHCRASVGSERAKAYAAQRGLQPTPVAIIIQAMVQSDVSGVAFSLNPVTANPQQIVVEAGLGLGEAVVSGEITPDMYTVDKTTHTVMEKYITVQDRKLVLGNTGVNVWQTIGGVGKAQKLTDEQIGLVAETAAKLEKHFDFPVDVEWAFADGSLYILQCRPITTTS